MKIGIPPYFKMFHLIKISVINNKVFDEKTVVKLRVF